MIARASLGPIVEHSDDVQEVLETIIGARRLVEERTSPSNHSGEWCRYWMRSLTDARCRSLPPRRIVSRMVLGVSCFPG